MVVAVIVERSGLLAAWLAVWLVDGDPPPSPQLLAIPAAAAAVYTHRQTDRSMCSSRVEARESVVRMLQHWRTAGGRRRNNSGADYTNNNENTNWPMSCHHEPPDILLVLLETSNTRE